MQPTIGKQVLGSQDMLVRQIPKGLTVTGPGTLIQPNSFADRLKQSPHTKQNPVNPLTAAYGGHLERVLSLTVGLGGISPARDCFSFGALWSKRH